MKKKLDELTKCKLIYSGELMGFGIIFIVLGILFITGSIAVADWKKWAFTVITLPGGVWLIIDFIWTLKSKKRRKKNCLLDKALLLPNSFIVVGLDIFALIQLAKDNTFLYIGNVNFFQYEIGAIILYLSIVYIFESIYHYYHIHPMVYEMLEEDEKKKQEESQNTINNNEASQPTNDDKKE